MAGSATWINGGTLPATPAAGQTVMAVDSGVKRPYIVDDGGAFGGVVLSRNYMTAASQAPAAATDTYISNSGILIPAVGLQLGMRFEWRVHLSKTAAGTAAAVLKVLTGANQSTADTTRLTLTQTTAQAAVLDAGEMIVTVYPTVISASGILAGAFGFSTGAGGFKSGANAQSSTFANNALGGLYMGLQINTGAAAAWTITGVHSTLIA